MKRALLRQMRKEWRDNVWLIVELSVVCIAIWALGFIMYALVEGRFTPRGFNPEDVYSLETRSVPKTSSEYIDYGSDEAYYSDLMTLIDRLRNNAHVEAVAVHWGGLPYNYNFSGNSLMLADEPDSVGYYGNMRSATPDYIRVMGIESRTGATQEQLTEMLRRGDVLLSDDNEVYEDAGLDVFALKGKRVIFSGDSSRVMRVGDIVRKVRRNDYELSYGGTIIAPIPEDRIWGSLAVRVKPGEGEMFKADFKNDLSLRRLRNVYLYDLQSLMDIREANQRGLEVDLRLYSVMIIFLLATVFLGLLGTFWFRLQQRVGEIAIRKVAGATRKEVFARILSEGMILLAAAVVIASAVVWSIVLYDSDISSIVGKDMILMIEFITIVLMAIGITLSLWTPARRAMAIEPAIAVKDE